MTFLAIVATSTLSAFQVCSVFFATSATKKYTY